MAKVRPLEVKAILPLLQEDWPDEIRTNKNGRTTVIPGPERLATALIQALDQVRASRTSYIGAIRIGNYLVGIGPYPGKATAMHAVEKQVETYGNLVDDFAVIPIEAPEGFEVRLKELDEFTKAE
jgi:hypothetical protein